MKKIVAVLACTVLGMTAQADNDVTTTKGFLGLELGAAMVQGDTSTELRRESSGVAFGLRLGAQSDEWRTMFILDYYDNKDDDQNMEELLLTADYFFAGDKLDMAFKPFIGLNVGYANYESTLIDVSGLVYGGQVGVVTNISNNVDLDLSYRYSLSGEDSFDSVGSVMFGFNYLY